MSLDAINTIKEAELQAEAIKKDAIDRAREIIQKAGIDAEEIQQKLTKRAQEEGEKRLEIAKNDALTEIKKIEQENHLVCEEIRKKATNQLDVAVKLIMGRIVSSNGHS